MWGKLSTFTQNADAKNQSYRMTFYKEEIVFEEITGYVMETKQGSPTAQLLPPLSKNDKVAEAGRVCVTWSDVSLPTVFCFCMFRV